VYAMIKLEYLYSFAGHSNLERITQCLLKKK
jgi:hypothetical protein